MRKLWTICLLGALVFLSSSASASFSPFLPKKLIPNAVGIGYSDAMRFAMKGTRFVTQWDWQKVWFAQNEIVLTGLWEFSIFQSRNNGGNSNGNRHLTSFALTPILRARLRDQLHGFLNPFLEIGVGPAVHTSRHVGDSFLGSNITFHDLIGGGVRFGNKNQFELNYHFIHYSNLNFKMPNNGITFQKTVTFIYHFS